MSAFILFSLAAGAASAAPSLDPVVVVMQGDALCAGAIMDAEGHVATAYHCVVSGGRTTVETASGERFRAEVVDVKVRWDLAVLAVPELAGRPYLPVASAAPEVGDRVWAIGHPYGAQIPSGFLEGTLRWSLSEGIVSQVGARAVQTTAPINPGNSGGPLVNEAGEIVGVVSRHIRADGLGFAARVEDVPALAAGDRGLPGLGGNARLDLIGGLWTGATVGVTLGAQAELGLRDRAMLQVNAALPVSRRWDLVQYGETEWLAASARAGLRQRVGAGQLTFRFDLSAGVAAHTRSEGGLAERPEGGFRLDERRLTTPAPLVNLGVSSGTFGVDFAWVWAPDQVGTQLSLRYGWPGRVGMY